MCPVRMARVEAAARVVLQFNEAFNRHDVSDMMRLMTDDCVLETASPAPDGTVYAGKGAVTRCWEGFFRESPHAHIKIEAIAGMGLRCVARWRYEWVDAAGAARCVRGVDLFQVKDGVICEQLSYVKGPTHGDRTA